MEDRQNSISNVSNLQLLPYDYCCHPCCYCYCSLLLLLLLILLFLLLLLYYCHYH